MAGGADTTQLEQSTTHIYILCSVKMRVIDKCDRKAPGMKYLFVASARVLIKQCVRVHTQQTHEH